MPRPRIAEPKLFAWTLALALPGMVKLQDLQIPTPGCDLGSDFQLEAAEGS
jgi:hypothetical protein